LRWRAIPSRELSWHRLESALVLRNERTGSTHLLEPPAGEVFRALLQAAAWMTAEDVARASDEALAIVADVLPELVRLGLAEVQSP